MRVVGSGALSVQFAIMALAATGCVGTRFLRPRSTPERVVPDATADGRVASGADEAPVIVDVVDGPASVVRVTGFRDVPRESTIDVPTTETETRREYACTTRGCGMAYVRHRDTTWTTTTYRWTERVRTYEPVCTTTPCSARLPPGRHTLVFVGSTGESEAEVEINGPSLVRHALTLRDPGTDVWGATVALWALGALAAVIGPAIATSQHSTLGADREPVGWGLTGGGAGLVLIGTLLIGLNRDTVVTPGATAVWTLELD